MRALIALLLTILLPLFAAAQADLPADRVSELERKLDALSQEIERMKMGEAAVEPQAADKASEGHAPAASKVYRAAPSKVSIGGYGEMTYQNFSKRKQDADAAGLRDEADFLRAVLYTGYKFNDWILFNSELEFEHGTTGNGRGEASLEQAYLDFRVSKPFGVRAGMMLVPMGITNEIHEPTTFHGARRPSVEQTIIPTTWRENGVGVFGEYGMLSYRTYLMTGLQAVTNTGVTGFSGANGLRSGRSSGAKSFAEDLAWVGRLDVSPIEGARAGASLYQGQADQGFAVHAVPVSLWEVHAQAEHSGAEVKALYAEGTIGNADTVNSLQGFTNAARTTVGSRLFGGYAEAAFNVLSLTRSTHYLAPFFRYERYDTQWRTPGGFSKNPANSRVEYAVGLTYKPIPQIAVKLDQQWKLNQARTGVNQWNLGLAYIF
ncbi:MAG: porin [Elusimicrobiota bacterium]